MPLFSPIFQVSQIKLHERLNLGEIFNYEEALIVRICIKYP